MIKVNIAKRILDQIGRSCAQDGTPDRRLDVVVEQYITTSSIHDDYLDRSPEGAGDNTTNVHDALKLFSEALPGWDITMCIQGTVAPKRTGVFIFPPLKVGEIRHPSQEPEDVGGVSVSAPTPPLAVLKAIFTIKAEHV